MQNYIKHQERFRQAGILKGSQHLGVASTDFDMVVELGDRGFIFVEFKTAGTSLNNSQRTLFTRLVKSSNKPIFVVVASHNTTPQEEIAPNSIVEEVLYNVGNGFEYIGFDTDTDGDLVPLNQFISTITWKVCPRLLNQKAELLSYDDFWVVQDMLKPWTTARGEDELDFYLVGPNSEYLDWARELSIKERKIGKIKQALALSVWPIGFPDEAEILKELNATAKDEDGRYWWEKYSSHKAA
jgi:hypothetical protein